MYHQTTKGCTNVNECHNALNASDHQAFETVQAVLLFAFIEQHHTCQLFMPAVALDFQNNDVDDSTFMLCLQLKNKRFQAGTGRVGN